jgi:sarcosine dehydrogenase
MHRVLRGRGLKGKVTLREATREMGILSIQGPNSRRLLEEALDMDGLEEDQFPFSTHREYPIKGQSGANLRAIRLTFVGELGWELHVPSQYVQGVYERLMASKLKPRDAGWRAIDCLSAEKGYRHWHEDVRSDDTPFEAGIGFTVNKTKLESELFFGARVLKKRRREGKETKKLICLTVNDPQHVVWGLEPIFGMDKKPIGFFRRGSYGFYLNKSIGYGYVSTSGPFSIKSLDQVFVGINGQLIPASVHHKHPFDPKNLRVKGMYES